MKQHTEETKAQVLNLRELRDMSYMGIVRALADQDVEGVQASTVIEVGQRVTALRTSGTEEVEWAPTFNDQLQAVREILDGNNGAGLDGPENLCGPEQVPGHRGKPASPQQCPTD